MIYIGKGIEGISEFLKKQEQRHLHIKESMFDIGTDPVETVEGERIVMMIKPKNFIKDFIKESDKLLQVRQ